MVSENKMEVINQIRKLCKMTRHFSDLVIETGYFDYNVIEPFTDRPKFVVSDEEDKVEALCFHWQNQSIKYGYRQSIAGDSAWGIILDAVKGLKVME